MVNSPPLLLLPGLLCDGALWAKQVDALRGDCAVSVVELLAHDSMGAMAQEVLRNAPPQFALAGLSMGGYVAFEVWRMAPERVAKLCFISTSARPDTEAQSHRRKLLIAMSRSGKFQGITPRLLESVLHPDNLADEKLGQEIMDMARRVGRDSFIKQMQAIMTRPDSRPDLARIKCKTLVIAGEDDRWMPIDVTREIADGITGAEFAIIKKAGHLAPMEQSDAISRLLKGWLGDG